MQNNTTSRKSFFAFLPLLFTGMLMSRAGMGESKPMFKGANLGYQNPIFSPRGRKLKGYQKSLATRSFNKNR